ncbi:MAG: hypothetical protein HY332_15835 [Chloroflexi bacterium]|nr:hypothetical protein [Chloroflexota bacterium]
MPDGVRWRTLSYRNEPHYDTSLYTGVAGVTLFLSDYHRLTESAEALALAAAGLAWCASPERLPGATPEGAPHPNSLYFGRAGRGMAWLRYAQAAGGAAGATALEAAVAAAEPLIDAAPGPWTEYVRGAAGEGVFLVRLWESSGDARHLEAALRRAEWLAAVAERDELSSS